MPGKVLGPQKHLSANEILSRPLCRLQGLKRNFWSTPVQKNQVGQLRTVGKRHTQAEIGTRPNLKCAFYKQNLISKNQPQFSRSQEGLAPGLPIFQITGGQGEGLEV